MGRLLQMIIWISSILIFIFRKFLIFLNQPLPFPSKHFFFFYKSKDQCSILPTFLEQCVLVVPFFLQNYDKFNPRSTGYTLLIGRTWYKLGSKDMEKQKENWEGEFRGERKRVKESNISYVSYSPFYGSKVGPWPHSIQEEKKKKE